MNPAHVFLAAALGSDLPKTNPGFGPQSSLLFSDVLLIIGLGLGLLVVLAALVYGWTKLKRKGRRHVSSGQKVFRGSHGSSDEHESSDLDLDDDEGEESEEESENQADKRKYKYRVRRRSHRSRNPTLSQTGGLPPVKAPEPTKPG